MDKEIIRYYLEKIENKAKVYCLSQNETTLNDLLNYIETCIEICNLMKRRFNKNVNQVLEMFQNIQSNVLLRDMSCVLTTIEQKKKELDKLQID